MALHDEHLDDVIASLIDDLDAGDASVSPAGLQSGQKDASTSSGSTPEALEGPVEVHLTPRAAKEVARIREAEKLDAELYLRVAVEGGGCSGLSYRLGFDHRTGEDLLCRSQQTDIVVDPRHAMYLNRCTIDYPDGLDARGFTFSNPNASDSCGCGSSFAV